MDNTSKIKPAIKEQPSQGGRVMRQNREKESLRKACAKSGKAEC